MRIVPSIIATSLVISTLGIPVQASATTEASAADVVAIQNAIHVLNLYKENQQKAGLQNPDIAYAMRKAVVLADLLLTANGRLNVSLAHAAKPYFVPQRPLEFEAAMGRFLDQFDLSWQPFFDQVVKPEDSNGISNLVLRVLLGLDANEAITGRHAKVAVLASLLAPYNQGPVGDCFAVADLIRDHEEYYQHAAKDYTDIVENGFLTRRVGQQMDDFFFLPIIADSDRDQTVTLDATGTLIGANISWMDAPGFAAVCRVMGGSQIPDFSTSVLPILFQGTPSGQIQVTVSQIIQACAQVAAAHTQVDSRALTAWGNYAFSSLTNNPVLRGAECAFAAMAEDRAQDSTRGNVNDCVAQALKSFWSSLGADSEAGNFQSAFSDIFNTSYRLVYNPDIPLAQVSADGSSTDGGFQQYQRVPNLVSSLGTRVETPHDFQQLVVSAVVSTVNQLGATDPVNAIANSLSSYVQTEEFIKEALWAYDEANKQEPDPVANYQKLSRTPMQSCDGDNPYEVDDIDTGRSYEANVQTYTPANAKDLLQWCLGLVKKAPAGLVPMDSPQHAFNFAPANPDLVSFVKKGMSSEQWIRQMLSVPGIKVASSPIDMKTKAALANVMWNRIANAMPDQASYQTLVAHLAKQPLSVQKYAQSLLQGINQLLGSDAAQASQVALVLDGALLSVLPVQYRSVLEQTAVRFAFTNWNDGIKDIYFCAYFNPRTEQVGFGCIDEDKTNLQPMDETAWVNHQQWDVDLRPAAPAVVPATP